MSRIILHAGPEKCGSSSIQSAMMGGSEELKNLAYAMMLAPKDLRKLDCPQPEPEVIAHFHSLIKNAAAAHPEKTLMLSHEMMFKMVNALVNLSKIAREHADEVIVVAYIRRQSDFLVSSFGQWLFRSPERIVETADVLRKHKIDPTLFWGVERHLIAAVLGGWNIGRQLSGHLYLDWSESIPERVAALKPTGVPISIGLLPRTGFDIPLISDFLTRANLDPKAGTSVESVRNPSYHPSMIEAVLNAIEAGHSMPGPHEANEFFLQANTQIIQKVESETQLTSQLKCTIDTIFEQKNVRIARELNLPPEYFMPKDHIDPDIMREKIFTEAAKRAAVPEELRNRERQSRAALAQMAWLIFQRQNQHQ
ncbi:hypothetical protein KDD17_01765 [Sulfitobacter albidus]|uniref:Uncharacterized protein n=1 Tax=Sulfitobacter albidus TaxID=2829501 RepID=A0A975JF12_9RHOB|nr:hypothetical protein [Sulfitobacter albidus]QUJ76815.1 hypothetical protein KDD17_01765 [Sulfitobacter albidus]